MMFNDGFFLICSQNTRTVRPEGWAYIPAKLCSTFFLSAVENISVDLKDAQGNFIPGVFFGLFITKVIL
jgi:hypothetical protein